MRVFELYHIGIAFDHDDHDDHVANKRKFAVDE